MADELAAAGVQVQRRWSAQQPLLSIDAEQMTQAFTHLFANACRAMPDGGTLTITVQPQQSEVVVEVADSGIGMSEEERQHVFEPFYGGGLRGSVALPAVYGIITAHGGSIAAESEPGKGTTFTIRLPVVQPVQETADEPAGGRSPLKILLVDDEELILDGLQQCLRGEGHQVETACRGREAVQRALSENFDVIICDLLMPEMDGREVIRRLAQAGVKTPVIVLTGMAEPQAAAELRSLGVHDVLVKPVGLKTLIRAVEKAVSRPPAGEPGPGG